MKLCTNVARDNFISLGTCIGKFTKTKKFKLHITALDLIAPLAKVNYSISTVSLYCKYPTIVFIFCQLFLFLCCTETNGHLKVQSYL